MNFLETTALTATIFSAFIALWVVGFNYRVRLHQAYLAWGGSVTLWNLAAMYLCRSPENALPTNEAFVWAKVLQLGVIFMPVSLFHVCTIIAQIDTGKWLRWLY